MVSLTEAHGWILSALLSTLGVLAWLLGDASTARYGSALCLLAAALFVASASQRAPELAGAALIFVLVAVIVLATRGIPQAGPGAASDRPVAPSRSPEFVVRPTPELLDENLDHAAPPVEFHVVTAVWEAESGADREPTT